MLRSEIQVALEAAAKIIPHREFVIAGSRSVLGYKEIPPEMMQSSKLLICRMSIRLTLEKLFGLARAGRFR